MSPSHGQNWNCLHFSSTSLVGRICLQYFRGSSSWGWVTWTHTGLSLDICINTQRTRNLKYQSRRTFSSRQDAVARKDFIVRSDGQKAALPFELFRVYYDLNLNKLCHYGYWWWRWSRDEGGAEGLSGLPGRWCKFHYIMKLLSAQMKACGANQKKWLSFRTSPIITPQIMRNNVQRLAWVWKSILLLKQREYFFFHGAF